MQFVSMEAPTTQANLPHDIIRRIIPMEESALDGMRLISPSWNVLVTQYISDTTHLVPLERAYLCGGPSLTDEDRLVRMYAIMPEPYAARVGYGKWLSLCERHSGGMIEVTSNPRSVAQTDGYLPWYKLTIGTIGFLITAVLVGIFYSTITGIIFATIVIIIAGCSCSVNTEYEEREKRICARFARFFASFSRIETLVLGNLWSNEIFAAVHGTLGDIPINRLEYRTRYFGTDQRNQVAKLCQKHGIRYVIVTADAGTAVDLRKLVLELSHCGIILDIFETARLTTQGYFGKPRLFWAYLATDLAEQDISMRMTTALDAVSARTVWPANTKSHIQIASAGSNYQATQARGFVNK